MNQLHESFEQTWCDTVTEYPTGNDALLRGCIYVFEFGGGLRFCDHNSLTHDLDTGETGIEAVTPF